MKNGSVTVYIFSLQLVTKIVLLWFHDLLVTKQLSMLQAGLQRCKGRLCTPVSRFTESAPDDGKKTTDRGQTDFLFIFIKAGLNLETGGAHSELKLDQPSRGKYYWC